MIGPQGRRGGPPDPWIPAWAASEGNGSAPPPGPLRRAADDPTITALWAFRPSILRWVLRRGVPDSDAEDLVQTILASAWRSRRRWDPESCSLHCWLYVIMRHHVHTYQNSAYMRHETPVADPPGRAIARKDPAAAADEKQGCKRALGILGRLPPRLAVLFTRYEVEGEPMWEVAAALGLPLSTAWGQLQQARAIITAEVAREASIAARRRLGRRE